MANSDHIIQLMKGATAWNAWRQQKPYTPHFRMAVASGGWPSKKKGFDLNQETPCGSSCLPQTVTV